MPKQPHEFSNSSNNWGQDTINNLLDYDDEIKCLLKIEYSKKSFELLMDLKPKVIKKRKIDEIIKSAENDSFFHDLIIHVKRNENDENTSEITTLKVNKLVLCGRSDVISNMLKSEFIEGKTSTMTIENFSKECVEEFIKFCYQYDYNDNAKNLENSALFELTELANYYNVIDLRKICEKNLILNYEHDPTDEELENGILLYAIRHNMKKLKQQIFEISKKNLCEIID